MSETGLTLKTAIECLEASGWKEEAALQLFQSVKVYPISFRMKKLLPDQPFIGYDSERGVYPTMIFSSAYLAMKLM